MDSSSASLRSAWSLTPTFTRSLLVALIAFHIVSLAVTRGTAPICFNPSHPSLLSALLWPFFHAGIFHLVGNCAFLYSVGILLERMRGSFWMAAVTGLCTLLSSCLFMSISLILAHFNIGSNNCTLGFSGVLFSLHVIRLFIESSDSSSTVPCFSFSVPRLLQPFILLIAIYFLVPNSSLLGHLCGLFVGHLYELGLLPNLIPSVSNDLEGRLAENFSGFRRHDDEELESSSNSEPSSYMDAMREIWASMRRTLPAEYDIEHQNEQQSDSPLPNLNVALRQLMQLGIQRERALNLLQQHNGDADAVIRALT